MFWTAILGCPKEWGIAQGLDLKIQSNSRVNTIEAAKESNPSETQTFGCGYKVFPENEATAPKMPESCGDIQAVTLLGKGAFGGHLFFL